MNRDGYNKLWGWFGLSRASFVILPRVMMHDMSDEWQSRMTDLLEEFDREFPAFDVPLFAEVRENGRKAKMPEWLLNYRHPFPGALARCRRSEP